jgi:thioredoxin-related protein
MQTLKLVILFSWLTIFSCAQRPKEERGKLEWLTLEEVTAKLQKEKRPVLIDLYTDWCGWCKVMDKRTYSNKNVSEYISSKFYPVKINAESKRTFTWNGKEYRFNESARTNDFAIWLTGGQLSYPTTVFIPVDGDPQPIPGFLPPNELELLVKYFGEGNDKKIPFEKWHREFKSSW